MTLLSLQRVGKRYRAGRLECVVLDDVSMSIEAGELVAVWGMRRSGRSTLLRIAAGIEHPDTGTVHFEGRDLGTRRGYALGDGIGYCRPTRRDREAHIVLDDLTVSARARGADRAAAGARAHAALERVGAGDCAPLPLSQLDAAETVRVTLARALTLQPRLLVFDDPIGGVDLLERDRILELLRSLADDGIAVLITVGESTGLEGANRALRIGGGGLGGNVEPELASVHQLRRQAGA